uniref:General transcription and DNA repair factor IIH subunit TFB4 n=1 Tax=Chlamydomonas leiostraca TaxID=1034604 RepID=A0A7S0RY66_9CHLO
MADENGDLLVLLLDTHLFAGQCHVGTPCGVSPKSLLEQVLYFVSAYLMINDHNHLAVYAVQGDASHLLHLSIGDHTPQAPQFSNPTRSIATGLTALVDAAGAGPASTLALSGALSRALCLIHRLRPSAGYAQAAGSRAAGPRCRPRILCLVGSPDVPLQYIPVMNAIFSAQRAEVAVDALVAGAPGFDSTFLQQAAHLTGGLYLRASTPAGPAAQHGGQPGRHHSHASAALQYLLSCLSADTATRSMLHIHTPLGVDFRASCFCHKQPVDVGYVCSVCLSIFCQPTNDCAICGTQFTSGVRRKGAPLAAHS